jgi:pimeloyl-ACP methyl ester carboxylesterase
MPCLRGVRTVAAMPTSDLHHELRGSGPPVLFISGASGDAGHFARTSERLTDEFTTVAYDRRGCSRSAPLPDGEVMSIVAQADDAAALIEQLGLASALVFGSSGGGDIALELVARRPEIVRGAVHTSRRSSLSRAMRKPGTSICSRSSSWPRSIREARWRPSSA